MFRIEYSSVAVRNLKHIRKEDIARIVSALEELAGEPDPIRHVKKLRGLPFYSLRVGNYRAILSFKQGVMVIFVIDIDRRETVYQRF
jgi:mRNA interferase RelE/StbE